MKPEDVITIKLFGFILLCVLAHLLGMRLLELWIEKVEKPKSTICLEEGAE